MSSCTASGWALLLEELSVLSSLIDGQYRGTTYRHHVFMRRAMFVRRVFSRRLVDVAEKRGFNEKSGLSSPCAVFLTETADAAAVRFQRCLVRCAEDTVNEMRSNRIDTLPIALCLLAITARLHRLVSDAAEEHRRWAGQQRSADGSTRSTSEGTAFGPSPSLANYRRPPPLSSNRSAHTVDGGADALVSSLRRLSFAVDLPPSSDSQDRPQRLEAHVNDDVARSSRSIGDVVELLKARKCEPRQAAKKRSREL